MKVVFLLEQSFLHTPQRTNPYFDPIIAVCDKYGIGWEMWYRSKRMTSGYSIDHVRKYTLKDTLVTVCYLFFIKIIRLSSANAYKCTRTVLTMTGMLSRDIGLFVTNALCYAEQACALYPDVKTVDVQHGILYSMHRGYFDEKGVLYNRYLQAENFILWLYGQGYKDLVFENELNRRMLESRVSIIGDIKRSKTDRFLPRKDKKFIVIASQMVPGVEFSSKKLLAMKWIYENVFNDIFANGCLWDYKVIFRHHPRFANCIDLSDWERKYPWLIMNDTRDWDEVYPETKCLLTLNSTSAFDAASYGVPTIIIDGSSFGFRNILEEDFNYPCGSLTVDACLRQDQKEYEMTCKIVLRWYQNYYETFSEDNCWRLLDQCMLRR